MVPAHEASFKGGQAGRSGGSGGARGETKERRVSLGIKQLEADPWTTVAERYSVGSVVEGRVRKLTDFGAFIEMEEGIDGLVHISDVSWTKRIKHPSEMLKKGQLVQAVVLHIDASQRRMSLGIKQLQPDAWEDVLPIAPGGRPRARQSMPGRKFRGFVELAEGVEGLCHNSKSSLGFSDRRRGGDSRGPWEKNTISRS